MKNSKRGFFDVASFYQEEIIKTRDSIDRIRQERIRRPEKQTDSRKVRTIPVIKEQSLATHTP